MAAFDPSAYTDQVLKPLRKQLPHLPGDLLTRYAVDLTMSADELHERIDAVVRVWNKAAMRAGSVGMVCKQLQAAHAELETDPKVRLTDPAYWQEREKARHQQLGSAIAELAAALATSHGSLGVITRRKLRAEASTHGDLSEADVEKACEAAGLEIVEPLELPTKVATKGALKDLETNVLTAGSDSVLRLLYPRLTEFGLLNGVTVTPSSSVPDPLSESALRAAADEREKAADSTSGRAAKHALGWLRSEQARGTDLHAVALFMLVDAMRRQRDEGVEARGLFALLARTGLREPDAARIAVSVMAEAATSRDPLTEVIELLAEGRLVAADKAATPLGGEPGTAAKEAVARQRDRVEELRRAASAELAAGRPADASARLREALGLAADLPGLAEELANVPAVPVLGVTAVPDGGGVRIGWTPAAGHDEATTFRVVRADGRVPADPDDGREIAAGTGTATTDDRPPVGRPLHYAVFARANGGRWSAAVSAMVQVVPPVTDLVVEGEEKTVSGRWRTHPDVAAVEVRRSAGVPDGVGEPVSVERGRSFRDAAVHDGVHYFYAVIACYPAPGGGVLRSEPVVKRGATRPKAKPIPSFSAAPVVGGSTLAVRLSWRQQAGSEVVVRRSGQPCRWEYGQLVPSSELERYGTELEGARTEKGETVTIVATVPPGRSHYVPFTIGPDGGLRGQDAVVDLTEPVRRVAAQRFGEDVRVTWEWPDAVSTADVVWAGGRRRITRAQYRDEGGCLLRRVPGVRRVEVGAAVAGIDTGESTTPATSVEVDERPPQLHYELRRRGTRFTGGVRATVTVSGSDPVGEVTVVLVAAAGKVMPLAPGAGMELLRAPVLVRPGTPVELPEVAVPGALRKPYWLRCFLAEPAPAVLVDPPVSQLKVS